MAAIRERSVKDAGCHEAEMKDLLRSIAHDKKLKNFMAVKANERIELKAIEATKKKKAGKIWHTEYVWCVYNMLILI